MVAFVRLVLLVFVAYIAFLFVRIYVGLKRARTRAAGEVRDVMFKDEICGTYVPREDALTEMRDGVEHHFCSEECRRKFLRG